MWSKLSDRCPWLFDTDADLDGDKPEPRTKVPPSEDRDWPEEARHWRSRRLRDSRKVREPQEASADLMSKKRKPRRVPTTTSRSPLLTNRLTGRYGQQIAA